MCTNNRSDFVPGTFRPSEHKSVQGIAVGLRIEGTGTLRWRCYDCTGQPSIITLEALLLPDLPIRLLSPQQLTKDQKNSFIVGSNESILLFQGQCVIIRHGMTNNLPVSFCINATSQECSNSQVYLSTLFFKHTNDNLTEPQGRLLNIHRRLNHVDMQAIQRLYADDPHAKALSSCPIPKCAECIFGTQTRKPKLRRNFRPIDMQASKPGDAVSTDQMISGIGGRIARGFGKSSDQYTCCTFFVDHFSRFAFAHPQTSANAYETLIGKNKFERLARSHGR